MSFKLIIFVLITSVLGVKAQDTLPKSAFIRVELMPDRFVPTYTADARSHRLMLQKAVKDLAFYGSMGAYFPMANITLLGKTIQLSAAASTFLTLKRYVHSGEVLNVDFFADFFADFEVNKNWYLRAGFGHTSQHIADDAITIGIAPKNYVKDYIHLQSIHKLLHQKILVYGGFYYFHNFKIGEANIALNWSKKILLQLGTEVDIYKISPSLITYLAADVKLRQEFNFGATYAFQAGIKLNPKQHKTLRFAYNYLGGYEERGFLYNQQSNLNTLGLYFDL